MLVKHLAGIIPVAGQPIEWVTNFTPAVFITRLLFNKYGKAKKGENKLEKDESIAKDVGVNVSKEKKVLKKVKELIDKENPVDALKEAKKADKEISSKIVGYVNQLATDTERIIQNIAKQNIQAPPELMNILQQGIDNSEQLIEQAQILAEEGDFENAIKAAQNAERAIIFAAKQFEKQYSNYLAQLELEQADQYQEAA